MADVTFGLSFPPRDLGEALTSARFPFPRRDFLRRLRRQSDPSPLLGAGRRAGAPPAAVAIVVKRSVVTAAIAEGYIRLLLVQYPFNSLHNWHLEILFIVLSLLSG
jgi:hypothetical protein